MVVYGELLWVSVVMLPTCTALPTQAESTMNTINYIARTTLVHISRIGPMVGMGARSLHHSLLCHVSDTVMTTFNDLHLNLYPSFLLTCCLMQEACLFNIGT